jgi:hypothetical protein
MPRAKSLRVMLLRMPSIPNLAKGEGAMQQYIVFGALGQCVVSAETWVRAVQAAIECVGGFAADWTAHRLSTYPAHLQARLVRESRAI